MLQIPDKKRLENKIRKMLPDAELVSTALTLCPELRLYLLCQDNMRRPFSQEETQSILSMAPYWAFCWASGQALASYIMANCDHFEGKYVLDFGAGSGVLAIAAAMAGASRAVACDIDPLAIAAIIVNASLNAQQVIPLKTLENLTEKPDIILAADVLYDLENHPFLDSFLDLADEVLIADSRLKTIPTAGYKKIAEIRTTTLPDLHESDEFNLVRIYRAHRGIS